MYNSTTIGMGLGQLQPSTILAWGLGGYITVIVIVPAFVEDPEALITMLAHPLAMITVIGTPMIGVIRTDEVDIVVTVLSNN